MKHIKLYESFLRFGRIYEAESSGTEDLSKNRNMVLVVGIVNRLWKENLLNRINKKISEGIKNPIELKLIEDLEIKGNLNLKVTNYKVNKISKMGKQNSDSKFSTYRVLGYANLELKYTIEGLEDVPIEISFTTDFDQKLELDFVKVVKIYPPALSISTTIDDGHIEEAGYVYLDNNNLMFCLDLDDNGKPQDPKTVATLKLQDKVEFAFDSSKKGGPFVYEMTEEEKESLNI
jgi:hypothetical protein